ncbi:MAG: sigma-54 dependent transcriptional regulator [Planctomycetota bacterium]
MMKLAEPPKATTCRLAVLVVDPDPERREELCARIAACGRPHIEQAASAREALARLERRLDVAVVDACLLEQDPELVTTLRRKRPDLEVLVKDATVEQAVSALRQGARDCLDAQEGLELLLEDLRDLAGERERSGRPSRGAVAPLIIGDSPAVQRARRLLELIARSPAATILITGESGTGKDLAARSIHAWSGRPGPFLNITCSALPEPLLESELFGHERGAFTDAHEARAGLLEQADGGTVFLDEIGEMTPVLQAKLLRFLEDRVFRRVGGSEELQPDVRVVAATHRDLEAEVEAGRFRADLYYRLTVVHAQLPALRERGEDVEVLAAHFVSHYARLFEKDVRRLSGAALRVLRRHTWPGNVRELKNMIERAVLLCDGDTLQPEAFRAMSRDPRAPAEMELPPEGLVFEALERDLVLQALQRTGWNNTRAAKLLGMTRDQIRYRITKFGLEVPVGAGA